MIPILDSRLNYIVVVVHTEYEQTITGYQDIGAARVAYQAEREKHNEAYLCHVMEGYHDPL